MGCRICGADTIKAHLLPRAFAEQVKLGSHQRQVIAYPGIDRFRTFNHGQYDADLLCGGCDGVLGELERKAFRAFNAGRAVTVESGEVLPLQITGDDLILFCAAIVWKYAACTSYKLSVGPYLGLLQEALFSGAALPPFVDAFGARIWTGNDQVYYYREPLLVRAHGVNFVRFSLGGFLLHLKLDQRPTPPLPPATFWLRGKSVATTLVMRFEDSPDWHDFQRLRGNTRLQSFLERNERQSQGG